MPAPPIGRMDDFGQAAVAPGRHPAGHADGARFRFVAGVTGWEYRAMGADRILLFYEPVSRVALLTFDWS